ncbi:MAG: glycosyltransferase family 2 protein [Sedimentisphaerales bacterium]|nr:glycosyltransferase family 2 protein [Sedimentisphaerales bacterium]
MKERYVIITPVRDEEEYIEKTIISVIKQTIIPVEWVIVNDGSTDGTGILIDKYAKEYPWIQAIHRQNRGYRKAGGGVIEAFYDGYNVLRSQDWNFIVKLDGDLFFDPNYFEHCFQQFRNNHKLGLGGGIIYNVIDSRLRLEENPLFHVRGATKIYKKECWDSIGGLFQLTGWDTLDEVKANMCGWDTGTFENIPLYQLKPTGAADGMWQNWVKNGYANYISGYHPLFMMLKCVKRILQRPYVIASAGLFFGFISGYMKHIPIVDDKYLIKYIRKQQIRKLLLRPSIWY